MRGHSFRSLAMMVVGALAGMAYVMSCGNSPSMPQMSIDMAMAQTAADMAMTGGMCGVCTVSGPITIQGPVKALTADNDVAQLDGGTLTVSTGSKLIDGPLVLTDVVGADNSQSNVQVFAVPQTTACSLSNAGARRVFYFAVGGSTTAPAQLTGAHLIVKANETLCAATFGNAANITWSGFHPY